MQDFRILAPAMLALPLCLASAQTPDTATFRRTVLPAHAVVGVSIRTIDALTGLDRTVTSTQGGQFASGRI